MVNDPPPSDPNAPDSKVPDSSAPDSKAPDSNAPDSSPSDSSAPDSSAPDSNAPDSDDSSPTSASDASDSSSDDSAPDSGTPPLIIASDPMADDMEAARQVYEQQMEQQVPSPDSGGSDGSGATALDSGGLPVAPDEPNQLTLRRRGPVCICDDTGEPMRGTPYLLVINDQTTQGHTDEQGWIEWIDTTTVSTADVYIGSTAYHFTFQDDPSDTTTLGQSMLNALGYSAGPLDGNAGPRTKSAVSYFQIDHDLDVSGEFDEATMAKLTEEHRPG